MVQAYFGSKTCKGIYCGMVGKKQKEWITELVRELDIQNSEPNFVAMKQAILDQLTCQPYCGQFLAYQLFDVGSSSDEVLVQKAFQGITDYDLIQIMNLEEIWEPEEWFDPNRMYEFRDKF